LLTVGGLAFVADFGTQNFNFKINDNMKYESLIPEKLGNDANRLLAVNPFIANTAKDYDMSYESVEVYYNRYGSTPMFYEKLEEHLKQRSF
jgi:hypothetical protein